MGLMYVAFCSRFIWHREVGDALLMQALRSRRVRQVQQEEGDAAEQQDSDEDAERETWLKQIALASLRATERLSSIQQVCQGLPSGAQIIV